MSEKLCLKWSDFQDNINITLGKLRSENEFSDVTLTCEDGQQVEAHKVILAASSPFFQKLLSMNKHPHPLIYMRGVESEDLVAIIDFVYYGEANVYQESIDAFLALAEELSLKGLTGNGENKEQEEKNIYKHEPTKVSSTPKYIRQKPERIDDKNENEAYPDDIKYKPTDTTLSSQSHSSVSVNITDIQELDEKVKSMMAKSQNIIQNGPNKSKKADICTVCGKEGSGTNIKDHIEANHLEGVSIPCSFCEKTFRSRMSQRQHYKKMH